MSPYRRRRRLTFRNPFCYHIQFTNISRYEERWRKHNRCFWGEGNFPPSCQENNISGKWSSLLWACSASLRGKCRHESPSETSVNYQVTRNHIPKVRRVTTSARLAGITGRMKYILPDSLLWRNVGSWAQFSEETIELQVTTLPGADKMNVRKNNVLHLISHALSSHGNDVRQWYCNREKFVYTSWLLILLPATRERDCRLCVRLQLTLWRNVCVPRGFNMQKFYIVPTECICVWIIRRNSSYLSRLH
jgi:hypothetical protein